MQQHELQSIKVTQQSFLQAKLKIGQPGDKYEREADAVADRVMSMSEPDTTQKQPVEEEEERIQPKIQMQPVKEEEEETIQPGIQMQAEEEEETIQPKIQMQTNEEEEENLQMKPAIQKSTNGKQYASADISRNINSTKGSGKALSGELGAEMGRKIGADFGSVRIHTDNPAVKMSSDLGAQAFTYGNDIFFNRGKYDPGSSTGKRLLAHELTHTLQQKQKSIQLVPKKSPGNQPKTGTTSQAEPQSPGTQTYQRVPIPLRGKNPADCIPPFTKAVSRSPVPTNLTSAFRRANELRDALINCVVSNAAASNASHHNEIIANEKKEISADIKESKNDLRSIKRRRRRHYMFFLTELQEYCQNKEQEIRLEFHYNVIFENEPSLSLQWGFTPALWNSIEKALAGLPAEATWTNPVVIRFRREECQEDEINKRTGQCKNVPRPAGGELIMDSNATDTPPPISALIKIYNEGLGTSPYPRASVLKIPATTQTLQHEVAHLFYRQLPQAEKDYFYDRILNWKKYLWKFITASKQDRSRNTEWQKHRTAVITDTGIPDNQLDQWLNNLKFDKHITQGSRTFFRMKNTQYYLQSFITERVPKGTEFDYARTDKDEYFAEIYTYALSSPEFLHRVLPADQIKWLKRVVFRTPHNKNELAKHYAINEPILSRFFALGSRLFTWEQLNSLFSNLKQQHQMQSPGAATE